MSIPQYLYDITHGTINLKGTQNPGYDVGTAFQKVYYINQ
jgi:hypothetical protein